MSYVSGVFEKALSHFRVSAPELKEERAMLLDDWLKLEKDFGDLGDVSSVQAKMPKKLKRKRPIETEDGTTGYVKHFLAVSIEVCPVSCVHITTFMWYSEV